MTVWEESDSNYAKTVWEGPDSFTEMEMNGDTRLDFKSCEDGKNLTIRIRILVPSENLGKEGGDVLEGELLLAFQTCNSLSTNQDFIKSENK